jgi:hypothetical protein
VEVIIGKLQWLHQRSTILPNLTGGIETQLYKSARQHYRINSLVYLSIPSNPSAAMQSQDGLVLHNYAIIQYYFNSHQMMEEILCFIIPLYL